MWTIAGLTFKEVARKKILLITLVLSLAYKSSKFNYFIYFGHMLKLSKENKKYGKSLFVRPGPL